MKFLGMNNRPARTSHRRKLARGDHFFADVAGLLELLRCFRGRVFRQFTQNASQLFIEKLLDPVRRVRNRLAVFVDYANSIAVPHPLRDHQSVDAISRQILHIAVQKTCTTAGEHSLAITNHGTNCRARAGECLLADPHWNGPQGRAEEPD